MRPFVDLTGYRIGRLLVKHLLPKRVDSKGRRQIMWRCVCDCGRVIDAHSSSLTQKKTQSCGCLHKELLISQNKSRSIPAKERLITRQFRLYRKGAEKRGLEFNLTKEEIAALSFGSCYICDLPPSNMWNRVRYSGIDRVDNRVGYTSFNSKSCCWECNNAKGTMSLHDFLELVYRIAFSRRSLVL